MSALIEQNALVNACNRMGVVPLHVAAARGHRELVDLLIQAGAHANPADSGAATILTLPHITSKRHRNYSFIHVIVIL